VVATQLFKSERGTLDRVDAGGEFGERLGAGFAALPGTIVVDVVSLLVVDKEKGRYVEIRGTVEITEHPDKRLLYEMYDLHMGGMAPPPEPDAERLIVTITPEKGYQFPPVPAAA
jgi:hypothetical protein